MTTRKVFRPDSRLATAWCGLTIVGYLVAYITLLVTGMIDTQLNWIESLMTQVVMVSTLWSFVECAAYRGRIITVGDAGRAERPPDLSLLRPANKRLIGVFLGAELALNPGRVHPMIQRHLEDLAEGRLVVVIDRKYSLSEAAAAHAYIESRQAFGRVILIP